MKTIYHSPHLDIVNNDKAFDLFRVKSLYPEGCEIVLDFMADEPFPLPSGSRGVVDNVDDKGVVYVEFRCGYRVGLIPGFDGFHRIKTLEAM